MKRVLLIILCIVGLWCACTEEKPGFYRGGGGLCFYPSRTNDSYPYFGDGIDGRDSMNNRVFHEVERYTLFQVNGLWTKKYEGSLFFFETKCSFTFG